MYRKENVRLIFSIIFMMFVLFGSTYLWKDLSIKNEKQVILMEDIDVCTDEEGSNLSGYNFVIDSNYDVDKKYNVQIVSDRIDNNDIHYTIDDGEVMSLNSDNMILRKNISANDEHSYIFKIWLTNDYQDNDLNVLINFE